eukprot:15174597-Alexandrium_andersonii.AAC.1
MRRAAPTCCAAERERGQSSEEASRSSLEHPHRLVWPAGRPIPVPNPTSASLRHRFMKRFVPVLWWVKNRNFVVALASVPDGR